MDWEKLLAHLIDVVVLVEKQAEKPWKKLLLKNLPRWAASGYLFMATRGERVCAVGVAGPVTAEVLNAKGPRTMPEDFNPEGERIYCAYCLVDKRYRGQVGRHLMGEMTRAAITAYPNTRSLVYARGLRGDERLRERIFLNAVAEEEVEV